MNGSKSLDEEDEIKEERIGRGETWANTEIGRATG